ncbi:MAG: HIT domain-containing protein [Clostridiales bacterium]|jgi:histidine triad (HIT) family protein|nr:HIT domain-containing protein [Clostridiales bacterium]
MSNCIFCKIISGDIPSSVLYEDEDFKVIMDISPASRGHAIILTKKHFENLYEIDDEVAKKVLVVAKKVAKAMKKELNCDGLNLLQNNGEDAGQSVFHIHFHLIPRYKGDSVKLKWVPGEYKNGEAMELAKRISSNI